jgi:anaerobic magnesium-protoporphyrin IX monomethyl ester cyclase
MKIFFLNVPARLPVVRRYMCSSFSAGFLFPPHDLLALAGVAKGAGHEILFTDAIAEELDEAGVISQIANFRPDLIVSILSFELYDDDVATIKRIKDAFADIKYGVFGHYPTVFAEETLRYTGTDFVMLGEPDQIFERFLEEWTGADLPQHVPGTVINNGAIGIKQNGEDRRVANPNQLPMPAYELLKIEKYKEPFMDHPTGLIQTARGCPFKCNYCVHSFGIKLTVLSPENVLEHILFLKKAQNIRSFRFIDDTFTAIPSRVIKICKLMIEHEVNLPWTCLSRADTLDEEMLHWMKKAGCIRLNIGIESGSQRILDILDKGINAEEALANVQRAKKAGLELMGFFLTGIPGETDEDVEASISFAKKAFDYVSVSTISLYPGTPLYEKMGHLVTFSLVPYQNYFNDPEHQRIAEERRRYFHQKFYFSFYFLTHFPKSNFLRSADLKILGTYLFKLVVNNTLHLAPAPKRLAPAES